MNTDDQMSIEERVRTATRAGASLIRDIPPLGAPAPVRLRRWPERPPRRWVNWGVPLAAAAAVAAIALTLVVVQPGHPAPAVSGSATAAPAAVPRYYVAPQFDGRADRPGPLILGDDLTGRGISVVSPPPGLFFTQVHGTSDDRTFLVEAAVNIFPYGGPPYSWYLLRVTPGSARPYQLTKLPIELPGSRTIALAYALSPDGRKLAVESTPDNAGAKPVITLAIYSVSTGARLRAWTAPTQQLEPNAGVHRMLAWLSGGRQLAFSAMTGPALSIQLRALDVAGTAADMMADSRVLVTTDNPATSSCMTPQVTPDGETAICATSAGTPSAPSGSAGCTGGALRFMAVPVPVDPSGKLARVLYQYPGACHDATAYTLWTDASASTIIGAMRISVASDGTKATYQIGVVADGHFRPLKIAPSIAPDDYADLVF